MVFEDISKGQQVILATETGQDGAKTGKTTCLTDDTSATSCVEVKSGQGIRAEWPHVPGAMSSVTLRIGVNSIMNAGTLRVAPYSDFDSINNTNGKTTASIDCAGTPASCPGDVDESLAQALIDDCLTVIFTFRLFENGSGAKIKVGELDVEATITTITLSGVTKDDDDVIVGSVGCTTVRMTGSFPKLATTIDRQASNATTGAYSVSYEDDGEQYRVIGEKGAESDITPEVQGV